jgi:hypothetical protein
MASTKTNTVNLSTGALNGKTDSAGNPVNTPNYYVQWCFDINSFELVDASTDLVIGELSLKPTIVAALAQAGLAAAPYITYPVGKQIMVTNWNATGFGVIIQKVEDVTNNFNDWRVVSTGTKASTGDVGAVPA